MDRLTPEQRRKNMQAVNNKGSVIEEALAKALWHRGYRYRRNVKSVYGHPDIAFIQRKIAIFVDSEFWHGKDWQDKKLDFKSNKEFWYNKIEANIKRDEVVNFTLTNQGWTIIRIWGEDIKKNLDNCLNQIIGEINNDC